MTQVSIENTVVFITGTNGEKGIGRALVEEALARGTRKVYATARRKSDLDDLAAKYPDKVVPLELDLTDPEQIREAARIAGDTQVLINNAGTVGSTGCLSNFDEAVARREMEVNFFGPMRLINCLSESLIKNGQAAIVNVVSIGGLYPSPMHVTYSASKAALYSLTQALRIEVARSGLAIPVFGVYPGPIDTDLTDGLAVEKESSANVAVRVFDGMEQGKLEITTDPLSDHFTNWLKLDMDVVMAIKKHYS